MRNGNEREKSYPAGTPYDPQQKRMGKDEVGCVQWLVFSVERMAEEDIQNLACSWVHVKEQESLERSKEPIGDVGRREMEGIWRERCEVWLTCMKERTGSGLHMPRRTLSGVIGAIRHYYCACIRRVYT